MHRTRHDATQLFCSTFSRGRKLHYGSHSVDVCPWYIYSQMSEEKLFLSPSSVRIDDAEVASAQRWKHHFVKREFIAVEQNNFCVYQAGRGAVRFVLLHGGGHTAQSWALATDHLKDKFEIYALDLRGHGETRVHDERNFAAEVFVADILSVIRHLQQNDPKPIVLVGHSLGGALAVKTAVHKDAAPGLCVVDVVEGTAVKALSSMSDVVSKMPKSFKSTHDAVKWSLQSGMLRNPESAQISIPSQLKRADDGSFRWRTDLLSTKPHWPGWFQNLSEQFLSARARKLLILAGTDRLDKTLMIGQMQGKYQLSMLPKAGHVIQEDAPRELADILWKFAMRNQFILPTGDAAR